MGTEAAFPSHSILRDFFPLSTGDLLVLSGRKGKKRRRKNYCVLRFLYFPEIFIFVTERQSAKPLSKKQPLLLFNQLSPFFFLFETRSCSPSSCQLQTHWNTFQLSQTGEGGLGGRGASHTWKKKTGKWLLEIWMLWSGYSLKDKTSPCATSEKVTTPPLQERSEVLTTFLTATRNARTVNVIKEYRSKHNVYLMLNSNLWVRIPKRQSERDVSRV